MDDEMDSNRARLNLCVGTGAGAVVDASGRSIPVVFLFFAKDRAVIDAMESGDVDFDPSDSSRWSRHSMSIRVARQLLEDLKGAVEEAIQGPEGP